MIILADTLHVKPNTILHNQTILEILKIKICNVESKHPVYQSLEEF
jgi:hypothetical protein